MLQKKKNDDNDDFFHSRQVHKWSAEEGWVRMEGVVRRGVGVGVVGDGVAL